MLEINIPGFRKIEASHLVLDYNGTLAIDGTMIPGVKELLNSLATELAIHIITADTFGNITGNMTGINCTLDIISRDSQQEQKAEFIESLGSNSVIAMGNGMNDSLMLKNAALGIAVIQKEGACLKTIENADVVCISIVDALELLKNPLRLIATLRN